VRRWREGLGASQRGLLRRRCVAYCVRGSWEIIVTLKQLRKLKSRIGTGARDGAIC
jgi:hypothetical protein